MVPYFSVGAFWYFLVLAKNSLSTLNALGREVLMPRFWKKRERTLSCRWLLWHWQMMVLIKLASPVNFGHPVRNFSRLLAQTIVSLIARHLHQSMIYWRASPDSQYQHLGWITPMSALLIPPLLQRPLRLCYETIHTIRVDGRRIAIQLRCSRYLTR